MDLTCSATRTHKNLISPFPLALSAIYKGSPRDQISLIPMDRTGNNVSQLIQTRLYKPGRCIQDCRCQPVSRRRDSSTLRCLVIFPFLLDLSKSLFVFLIMLYGCILSVLLLVGSSGTALATVPDPVDYLAIRDVINQASADEDAKNFDNYGDYFDQQVHMDFLGAPTRTDLASVIEMLSAIEAPITSHHLLGTQVIAASDDDANEATAKTSVQAAVFKDGQYFVTVGWYQDKFKKEDDGSWKIYYRNVTSVVCNFPLRSSSFDM